MNTAAQPATAQPREKTVEISQPLIDQEARVRIEAGPDCCFFCWAGDRDREVRELRALTEGEAK